MARRDRLDFRDAPAGGGELARVTDGIAEVAGAAVASGANNAAYGPGAFTELTVLAAVFNGTMAAFSREVAAVKNKAGGVPTAEWARRARGAPPTDREAPFLLDDEGDREFADAMLDVYERKVAEAEAGAGAAIGEARPAA